MQFRIASTFTDSLAKLSGDEQKQAKTTAFDLQMNPANPGMQLHKLERAKDDRFWSVRVSRDLRIIVHRSESSLLLCYVAHHDKAYQWAVRRKLETHPKTGAAQLVEIRETAREIAVPTYEAKEEPVGGAPLFAGVAEDALLSYGVPAEWVDAVQQADEDGLLKLAERLPEEAAEALLELATGGQPASAATATEGADPFEHPDAQRRFRLMTNTEELAQALDYPWEKWTVFLHPAQRVLAEKDFNGPARVAGSAGTGKTIVALHRAVHLARRHPDSRVLLTTFSETLANALRVKLRRLIGREPRLGERVDVRAIDDVAERLYAKHREPPRFVAPEQIRSWLREAREAHPEMKFSERFLVSEWTDVVDAWQLNAWEDYRDITRLGRRTRLREPQRAALWAVFEAVRARLREEGLLTRSALFSQVAEDVAGRRHAPFDFAVVDEAQDVSVAQLRFLAALGGNRPNSVFFAGDLGQRIFQAPFSWRQLGVDIRGRSQTLRINYRTSHQIRMQADRLLGPEVSDVDGNVEDRRGTVSVFNGPAPMVHICDSADGEVGAVSSWLKARTEEGVSAREIGIFVRTADELFRAQSAVEQAGLTWQILDDTMEAAAGAVSLGTMHRAKGLEFRAVAVMACDDEVIPLQSRIESVGDDADLQDVYETERHLLYVACTRARDHLIVSGVDPASEFLDDMNM